MPKPKTLAERYSKFVAKMAPDRVGTRYEAAKPVALNRYVENISGIVDIRERVRHLLSTMGVPSAEWALYISFAQKVASFAQHLSGDTLIARVEGAKANFVARGADPDILTKLTNLITGGIGGGTP